MVDEVDNTLEVPFLDILQHNDRVLAMAKHNR